MQRQSVDTFLQDMRFGLRLLRRSRGFAATTIVLLALGIGANTAIFSVISSAFLRPLPFPDPDRLVLLWDDMSSRGGPTRVEAAAADYVDWNTRSRSFTGLAAMASNAYSLTGNGEPEKLSGIRTTANLFTVIGSTAVVGRPLLPEDDAPGAEPVVVISEPWWRTRFGADPAIVGRTLTLDGAGYTVVGVVPADFRFPNPRAVLWVPARFTAAELAERFNFYLDVVGRIKPDVSLDQARAEMDGIAKQLSTERGTTTNPLRVTVTELREQLTRDVRRPTILLVAGALLILLITCANVAGLLLAHGVNRRAELTVRNVLGAGQSRLVRQLLTESVVIAISGAALGVVLASLTFDYLRRLVPPNLPGRLEPTLDARVLAFTIAVTAVVVLAMGTVPTWLTVRSGLDAVLRSNARRLTSHAWPRSVLVVVELALTVVLLTGAGLLLRSYANVLSADAGFDPHNLLIVETTLSPQRYQPPERRQAFYNSVLGRVRGILRVSSAGYVNFAPLVMKGGRVYVRIEGRPLPPPEDSSRFIISDRAISPGYLSTLRTPILRGRDFDSRDTGDSPPVAIINDKMARLHWPDEDPIGRRFAFGAAGANPRWITIVGVAANIRQMGLDVPPEPELYVPASQPTATFVFLWPQHLVVRTQGNPMGVAAAVRQAVWSIDRDQPVSNIRTMDDVFDTELLARNTQLTLVSVFAALALTIAIVGLYGLLAHGVSQRLRDIGIRMALGAQRSAVVADVARRSTALVGIAVAVGLAGALLTTRLLQAWLYDVSPGDPVTFGSTALLLFVAALAACVVPAVRAASVDPAIVLRAE